MSNQEPETFHPGDHIQAIGSLNHLESIQPVSTNMKLLHHRIGEVEEINQGMVVAAFPRPGPGPTGEPPHRFEFNPAAIRHVQPLGPGRTVVFAVLKSHLHRLEPERASRAMHPYLGRAGMIEDVLSATEYRVRFGPGEDAVLVLSPCSLIVGEGLERLADFEIGTHVRIIRDHAEFQRVQSLLGEWTTDYWNLAGCEGIVVGFVLGFLNVSIPSLGLKVRLSPLALEPQGHTNPEEQVTVRTHAHALVRSDGHPDGECTACGQAWTDEVVWTCGKDSCWILMCSTCVEAYQSDQPRPETGRPVVVSVGASKDDKADAKESGFAGLEGFELSRSRKLGSLVLFHNGRVQRIPTEKLKPSKPMTTGDTVHFCDNHSLPTALGDLRPYTAKVEDDNIENPSWLTVGFEGVEFLKLIVHRKTLAHGPGSLKFSLDALPVFDLDGKATTLQANQKVRISDNHAQLRALSPPMGLGESDLSKIAGKLFNFEGAISFQGTLYYQVDVRGKSTWVHWTLVARVIPASARTQEVNIHPHVLHTVDMKTSPRTCCLCQLQDEDDVVGFACGHGGCMFFLCSSCAKEFEGKKQDGEQVLLKYDQTPPPTSSEMVLEIEAEDDVEAKAITTPKTPAPTETKQTAPEPSVLDDPKLKYHFGKEGRLFTGKPGVDRIIVFGDNFAFRLPRDAQLQKDFKGFQPNMLVTFDLHNIDATKRLQEGHGGWNSDMDTMTKDMRVNKITDSGNVQTGNRFNRLFLNPLVVIWKGETSVDCDEETGMERLRSSFESLEEDACRVS